MNRRWMLLVAGLAVLAVAVTIAIVWVSAGEQTRLRVDVAGLPKQVAARVQVVGPVTYTVTSRRDEREVPPGNYTMRVRPVDTDEGKAYPEHDETPVTVRVGQNNTARAEYVVIIPETTKVLDEAAPGITKAEGRKVTFANDSPSLPKLKPGNTFIVAEGPQTPQPLVRRVEKVTRTKAGVVVDTTPVTWSEALPQGRFRLEEDSAIGFRPALSHDDGFEIRPAYFDSTLSINFAEMIRQRSADDGEACGRSAQKLSMGMEIGKLRPKLSGTFDWGVAPPEATVDITATLSPEIAAKASVSAAISCQVKRDAGLTWLSQFCGKIVGKLVRVGPISLSCKVEAFASATLQAEAALSFKSGVTVHGGIERSKPTFGLRDPHVTGLHQEVIEGSTVNVSAGGEVGLIVGLYGGDPTETAKLGLKVELGFGPEFTVKTRTAGAELNLKFRMALKAEMTLDLRFKEWAKERKLVEFVKKFGVWKGDASRFQTPMPAPPCPSGSEFMAAANQMNGVTNDFPMHDKVCAGLYAAGRWEDFHGITYPIVLKQIGGDLVPFEGTGVLDAPQCDKPEIKRAPYKIRTYVGCGSWRATPSSGSPQTQVAARQRMLFAAIRDHDAARACSLLDFDFRTELERQSAKSCTASLDTLRRMLGSFDSAEGPEPALIQAVPGEGGFALTYAATSDGLTPGLIWETNGDRGPWLLARLPRV